MSPRAAWDRWHRYVPNEAKVLLDRAVSLHHEYPDYPGYWWVRSTLNNRPPWLPIVVHFVPPWEDLLRVGGDTQRLAFDWRVSGHRNIHAPWLHLSFLSEYPTATDHLNAMGLCNQLSFLLGLPYAYQFDQAPRGNRWETRPMRLLYEGGARIPSADECNRLLREGSVYPPFPVEDRTIFTWTSSFFPTPIPMLGAEPLGSIHNQQAREISGFLGGCFRPLRWVPVYNPNATTENLSHVLPVFFLD